VQEHFFSRALGRQDTYTVYLPAGYAAAARRGERFGVLYLLHGSPGSQWLFVEVARVGVVDDTLVHEGAIRPLIIAMPSGRDGTFKDDTQWANSPHGRYGSYVLDVVRNVDRRFATVPDRRHRAIAGNSEGAYGAINLALRHLGTFSVAESWSGYYSQFPAGPFKGASPAALAAASPAAYVPSMAHRLTRLPLHALLYGGRLDAETAQLMPFAAELRRAGADVTARIVPGHHDWAVWRRWAPWAIRYAGDHMGGPPAAATHAGGRR
jgi:enterochelin esterase-like enzyme